MFADCFTCKLDKAYHAVSCPLTRLQCQHTYAHVLQIRLKHHQSNCEFNFLCDKWISMSDDNKTGEDFILELPVVRPDIAPLQG